jgi:hypothetical protein
MILMKLRLYSHVHSPVILGLRPQAPSQVDLTSCLMAFLLALSDIPVRPQLQSRASSLSFGYYQHCSDLHKPL